jgi:thiamine biosynthesis lipoprotein
MSLNFMHETRILMGMPVTIEVLDAQVSQEEIDKIFNYFRYVDEKFSTYKDTSEIMAINRAAAEQRASPSSSAPKERGAGQGELPPGDWSKDMKEVFKLSEETKNATEGYFEIKNPKGTYDPSGMVKGWAIWNAAKMLRKDGFEDFYVDAGGDIQPHGKNKEGKKWSIGIRNPFKPDEIVKTVYVNNDGVATSGNYIRGEHIYNPKDENKTVFEIVSLTVIGPNIYEADRFATAAFAMGAQGIHFIEKLPNLEAYMINREGIATMTRGFEKYTEIRS